MNILSDWIINYYSLIWRLHWCFIQNFRAFLCERSGLGFPRNPKNIQQMTEKLFSGNWDTKATKRHEKSGKSSSTPTGLSRWSSQTASSILRNQLCSQYVCWRSYLLESIICYVIYCFAIFPCVEYSTRKESTKKAAKKCCLTQIMQR